MEGIPIQERRRLGAQLEHTSQEILMAQIPQFTEAEILNMVPQPLDLPETLGVLASNVERGVHLMEPGDFLEDCPQVRPFDAVLASGLGRL